MPSPAGGTGAARRTRNWSVLVGAAFLMATSAIGPGFLTQTALFTNQFGASFGFAILVSIIFDLAAQLNIWRTIIREGRPAQVLANEVVPGLGYALSALVAIGGFAFNIGNIAGCGLGLSAMFGLPVKVGAVVSAVIAIGLFLSKEAGRAMDRFAQLLGILMVVLAAYVAFATHPPVGEAIVRTFVPTKLGVLPIITIVGGTVGGYIAFAGAHRLLDAGLSGVAGAGEATRSALLGLGIASLMRVVLFLGTLGIVSAGISLDPSNPAATAFRQAAGDLGYRMFGVVMWAASVTSVVGSAYTSVSFVRTLRAGWETRTREWIVGFIVVSTVVFLLVGRPVTILVLVGALNGFILPLGLGTMIWVAFRRGHLVAIPTRGLALVGAGVVIAMAGLGAYSLVNDIPALFR
ncbi:MAG: NRAMP family divalent metal transporter [Gemmatimonadota bacterium]